MANSGKCYQLEKNQMQFSPSKFCSERRVHFVRVTGIRVAVLDLFGRQEMAFAFQLYFCYHAICASLCQIPPVAAELLGCSEPTLFKIQKYLSQAMSDFCNIVYRFFFPLLKSRK